jgi:hypothetical protein
MLTRYFGIDAYIKNFYDLIMKAQIPAPYLSLILQLYIKLLQ